MKILILVLTILTINMPHPIFSIKQRQVYHSEFKDFSLLWGKTGSGKSFVANLKFYKWICRAPKNSKFILSGNTQESLHDNVISELKKFDAGINWLQYKTVANKQRLIVKHTGTRVKCIGANNEKAQDRIQGGNEDGWYADEVIKQPKSFVDMAISRCRYEKNGVLTFAPVLWTFNPDGQSHYIKTDYFDKIQEINGEEIFFSFEDNPLIYDEIKKGFKGDFVDKIKKRFTGVFKLRMVEGKWANAEGVIYDKFDRNKHIVESYPIPEVKEYVLGIDWGYAKEYVEAMYLMLQQDKPDDYIIATGETHTVNEFCKEAFNLIGIKNYMDYIEISSKYFRPSEVDVLIGNAKKAEKVLDWKPKVKFKELVKVMINGE